MKYLTEQTLRRRYEGRGMRLPEMARDFCDRLPERSRLVLLREDGAVTEFWLRYHGEGNTLQRLDFGASSAEARANWDAWRMGGEDADAD